MSAAFPPHHEHDDGTRRPFHVAQTGIFMLYVAVRRGGGGRRNRPTFCTETPP
ncbi:hypothetical protein [Brucella gallinifaecis]|uniref:hypothetical protein n=1 Tax=Brucella gallinifaecis TaxID=215590 RepID=UPI00130D8F39|nr:hypothetical protein [Brucella gallinifaecis]